MDDLIKRLQNFENHQLTADDQYGAEVLHHAWKAITHLRSIVEKADAVAKSHKENNFCCPKWRDTDTKHNKNCPVRAYEQAKEQEDA